MADNNLTIGISVETAKAKADLKLFNAEIANTTKALNAAVKAGDATGQAAQQQTLTGLYLQQGAALAKVTAAKKADTAATRESTQANRAHATSLKEAGLELGHLAHAAGLPIEGLRALRAGFLAFAATEVVRGVTFIADKINEITLAAKESGTTVEFLKGLQDAFRAAGDDASKAAPMMATFTKVLRESRLTPVFDPKGAFESLGIGSSLAYEQTLQGTQRAAADAAREILRLKQVGRIDDANTASVRNFGFQLAVVEEELRKLAAGTLRKFPAPTKEEEAAMATYNQSVADLAVSWDKLLTALATSGVIKEITTFLNDLNTGIQASINQIQTLAWYIKGIGSFYGLANKPTSGPPADSGFGGATLSPLDAKASGGYIRGAGSGTSDSILARLSNGEFVINAGSTRRLGASFLNGLNSFAAGGLVNVPPIRFAAGGLVPSFAGGGQAIAAFHFESGSSFRLGGPVDVVNAMVDAANQQQMRSAGVKPSWFGGRSGTR